VKPNSLSSASKSHCGVGHSSVALLNIRSVFIAIPANRALQLTALLAGASKVPSASFARSGGS
jgi:hypothetical protein